MESTSDDDDDPPYWLHRHLTTALAPHGPDGQQCEDYVEQRSGREKQRWNEEFLPERLDHALQISNGPAKLPPDNVPDDWDAKAMCWSREPDKDLSGADKEIDIGRTYPKMEHRERNGQSEALENEDQNDKAARDQIEAKNSPKTSNIHADPRPSPSGCGDHIFYPGRPLNKAESDLTMINMSSGEKNRREPNSQSKGRTSHIPASEGPCEQLKNEDLGEEFRDIAVAEQLTNLRNARAPGAEPFYGCREAYSDLGHIQEEGLDDYPEDAPDPLYINYLPPPERIPNGLLAAVRIFPFAVDDESRELHFRANGVTLATEDRHGNATYYHGDATIRIEEPNPGAAVEVPRRGRTNEMRNR